eukprot:10123380-Alexandrium_andersonii.AAC.1
MEAQLQAARAAADIGAPLPKAMPIAHRAGATAVPKRPQPPASSPPAWLRRKVGTGPGEPLSPASWSPSSGGSLAPSPDRPPAVVGGTSAQPA